MSRESPGRPRTAARLSPSGPRPAAVVGVVEPVAHGARAVDVVRKAFVMGARNGKKGDVVSPVVVHAYSVANKK
jgi:hypothetical protein